MRYSHVRLLVTDFAACFRFYRDIIGLRPKWGDENDHYVSFVHPDGGEVVLALFGRQAMAEAMGTDTLPAEIACQDRVALIVEVDAVDTLVDSLRTRGVELVAEPRDYPEWGIRSAYVRDPGGNLIELSSGLDFSKWTPELQVKAHRFNPA